MVSLLQLDIEPCVKMTTHDWKRPALEIMLKLYHEHPILYDMRHPKYYAKMERQKALTTIIDLLEDHRPGTTTADILKKIQTMRTQFGQEYSKVRRAQAKGTEYVPTIWWYQHLSFLRKHIKPRNIKEEMDELQEQDQEDYMSVSQVNEEEYENYTTEEAYDLENSEIVYEIQSSGKGLKEEAKIYNRQRERGSLTPTNVAGKEEIIYEITNSNTVVPKRKVEVISSEELPNAKKPRKDSTHDRSASSSSPGAKRSEVFEITVEPDRAKCFGQFVASQIGAVKDDFLFYSTQMEVLNVINKAQLKQLQMDKDAASK